MVNCCINMFFPVEVDFTLTVVECGFVILSLFVDVILVICISFDSVSAKFPCWVVTSFGRKYLLGRGMPLRKQRPNISHVSLMFQAMTVQLGYDLNDNQWITMKLVNYPTGLWLWIIYQWLCECIGHLNFCHCRWLGETVSVQRTNKSTHAVLASGRLLKLLSRANSGPVDKQEGLC